MERRAGPALETSWGNAGMIAPGHSFAWSSPQAPMILLKSLFARNQALRFRPSVDPRLWTWSLLFLRQCTEERARINTLRKHCLCTYSQKILHETVASNDLHYDQISRGILYFHRTAESLERAVRHMQILADDGQEIRVLDRSGGRAGAVSGLGQGQDCRRHLLPTDETGDCNKFTSALAAARAPRRRLPVRHGGSRVRTEWRSLDRRAHIPGQCPGGRLRHVPGQRQPDPGAAARHQAADLPDQGLLADDPVGTTGTRRRSARSTRTTSSPFRGSTACASPPPRNSRATTPGTPNAISTSCWAWPRTSIRMAPTTIAPSTGPGSGP